MKQPTTTHSQIELKQMDQEKFDESSAHALKQRRRLITTVGVAGATAAAVQWRTPIVNAVLLPAHAQTSMCVTDSTVGGPLLGNASGATTCQAACEAEAADQSAQLCAVSESVDGAGATQCSCDLDLPG